MSHGPREHYGRGLRRSMERHPPFTPRVMLVWIPCILLLVAGAAAAVITGSSALLVASYVLGAATGPIAFGYDFQHRTGLLLPIPARATLTGMLVGGPVAVLAAAAAQRGFPPLGANASTLLVGPIEEAAKLLVAVLALGLHRMSQREAVICALATAGSFQVVENLIGAFGELEHGDLGRVTFVLVARGILGPFSHCMWTATVAIGWFGTHPTRHVLRDPDSRRLVGWFVVVALTHSLWDVATGLGRPVLGGLLAGAMFAATLLAHHLATRRAAAAHGVSLG